MIASSTGVQQGDPLGPLLFSAAVHHIASSMVSPLNIWYLDDCTLGGDLKNVLKDFRTIIACAREVGLTVNVKKCELISHNHSHEEQFLNYFPECTITIPQHVFFLGSPSGSLSQVHRHMDNYLVELQNWCNQLSSIKTNITHSICCTSAFLHLR